MLGTGCDSRRCDEVKSSQARPSRWAQVAKALRIGSEEAETGAGDDLRGAARVDFPLPTEVKRRASCRPSWRTPSLEAFRPMAGGKCH